MNFQQQIAQSLIWRGLYFASILVMNIFLSRYFEAGNAGWIFYLCNNFSFLLILVGLTMENGISYYSSRKEVDDRQLTWFSLLWTFIVAVVVFVGLWFYFGRYKNTSVITRADYLFYATCYISGIQLTNIFTILFYARKNFFLPNVIMLLLNVFVIVIIPKQQGMEDSNGKLVINLYFAYFVLTGLFLAVAYIIKTKSWQNFSLPALPALKLVLRYALMSLAANVIFFLVYRVDYWFVKRYCPAIDLGNYIQVSKLGQMLLIIPSIISSVVFPHTASGMQLGEMKDNILRIGRITTVLYVVLFLLVLFVGKWLFPVVFGNTFQLMYWPFLLLLPGIWSLSNLSILSAYFAGINKVKVNINGAIAGLVIILAGDFLFIPRYGIYAAAIVSSLGYTANFLYSFFNMRKVHLISISEYWSINKEDIKWIQAIIKR